MYIRALGIIEDFEVFGEIYHESLQGYFQDPGSLGFEPRFVSQGLRDLKQALFRRRESRQ